MHGKKCLGCPYNVGHTHGMTSSDTQLNLTHRNSGIMISSVLQRMSRCSTGLPASARKLGCGLVEPNVTPPRRAPWLHLTWLQNVITKVNTAG